MRCSACLAVVPFHNLAPYVLDAATSHLAIFLACHIGWLYLIITHPFLSFHPLASDVVHRFDRI